VWPTSVSARVATFRPPIELLGKQTRVLGETTVVNSAGRLDAPSCKRFDGRCGSSSRYSPGGPVQGSAAPALFAGPCSAPPGPGLSRGEIEAR
jgi:hypothetical protein